MPETRLYARARTAAAIAALFVPLALATAAQAATAAAAATQAVKANRNEQPIETSQLARTSRR